MRMTFYVCATVAVLLLLLVGSQREHIKKLSYFFTTEACAVGWCANFTCYNSNQCGSKCVCAFEGNEQVGTCRRFE